MGSSMKNETSLVLTGGLLAGVSKKIMGMCQFILRFVRYQCACDRAFRGRVALFIHLFMFILII